MRPLVSVVIPAHNPGAYVEPCVNSLLRQTLPREQFEVIFVDDGSTDGTGPRLNRLAREQPHVRVIHIPASGAPGRPRNVGLEAALGEYVQFLDADDELAPRALARLLHMARANDADIVLGKFASETMNRRQDVFNRNRPATTFAETPQLADASMGPTKLFRAALLRDHEITFPEGWRQMEDQLFTMRAYLVARVISILGDEPCYFFNKREDEGHISGELVDPDSHAEHLGQVLDEVDAIPDRTLRSRLMARFYRLEVLARLGGRQFLDAPADHRARLFEHLREIARTRIDDDVRNDLGAVGRVRSTLLLEGSIRGLLALAERVQALTLDARLERSIWSNGRLVLEFRALLRGAGGGHALTVREVAGELLLDASIADDLVGPVDVGGELGSVRAQVSVVDRETALEWVLPSRSALELRPVERSAAGARLPTLAGVVEIDPQRVGPGEHPLDGGTWDVQIRWSGFGVNTKGALRFRTAGLEPDRPPIPPALLGRPPRWVVPRADSTGALRLAIGGPDRVPARIDARGRRILRDGSSLAVALPIATDRGGRLMPATLRLAGDAGTFLLQAWLKGSAGSLLVDAPAATGGSPLPRGRYEVTAHLGGAGSPGIPVGAVIVREDGRMVLLGSPRESGLARARAAAAWAISAARLNARARFVAAYRRLPQDVRDGARSIAGRARG